MEDASGQIAFGRALIEQWLNVALGENATTTSYGIASRSLLGQLIHSVRLHIEQGGHLVYKSAGATGAAIVHTRIEMTA